MNTKYILNVHTDNKNSRSHPWEIIQSYYAHLTVYANECRSSLSTLVLDGIAATNTLMLVVRPLLSKKHEIFGYY